LPVVAIVEAMRCWVVRVAIVLVVGVLEVAILPIAPRVLWSLSSQTTVPSGAVHDLRDCLLRGRA